MDVTSTNPDELVPDQDDVEPFAIVPAWVCDYGLSGAEWSTYVALRSYADGTGLCWPRAKKVATRAGLSIRTTEKSLSRLRDLGLITSSQRFAGAAIVGCTYQFAMSRPAPTTLLTSPTAELAGTPSLPAAPPGHLGGTPRQPLTPGTAHLDGGVPAISAVPPVSSVRNVVEETREPITELTNEEISDPISAAAASDVDQEDPAPPPPAEERAPAKRVRVAKARRITWSEGEDPETVPAEKYEDLVQLTFKTWADSKGGSRAKLDAKRRKAIDSALADYPAQDVLDAVAGWRNDDWADRPRYNDLTILLRNAGQIEKFRDLNRGKKAAPPARARGSYSSLPPAPDGRHLVVVEGGDNEVLDDGQLREMVDDVLDHWAAETPQMTEHEKTPRRRQAVIDLITDIDEDLSAAVLKRAISAWRSDDWAERADHVDVTTLLRDKEQVGRLLGMARLAARPSAEEYAGYRERLVMLSTPAMAR